MSKQNNDTKVTKEEKRAEAERKRQEKEAKRKEAERRKAEEKAKKEEAKKKKKEEQEKARQERKAKAEAEAKKKKEEKEKKAKEQKKEEEQKEPVTNRDNNPPQSKEPPSKEEPKKDEVPAGSDYDGSGWLDIGGDAILNAIGATEFMGLFGNKKTMMDRQHLFDPTRYRAQYKTLNSGKMPNNLDPYPVDLKIEELELHTPNVKIYEWDTPVEGKEATMCAMQVADKAEKRIVKLENMIATLYRLFFRIGSRVPINCVYYGGQSV